VYQALLTKRYLTSKIMPLLAAVAVTLCTAMVLIVWSVMGGFLTMLIESGRTLIGDVSVTHLTGFAYYEDFIERLEREEDVEAATPLIETYGLVSLPFSSVPARVVIKGIDAPSFDRVTGYGDSLWWRPLDQPLPKDKQRQDLRLDPQQQEGLAEYLQRGRTLQDTGQRPPLVLGLEVGGYNERQPEGFVIPYLPLLGDSATVSVLAMDRRGRVLLEQQAAPFTIVNQFRSGLFEIDANTAFVPLKTLQRMLKMDAAVQSTGPVLVIDPETGEQRFEDPSAGAAIPARVSTVLIRGKASVDSELLRDKVEGIYRDFALAHINKPTPPPASIRVMTWQDQNATLIAAVKKETALVLFIFGIVSLTAVFLVLAIFWAMVSEKTKDIGILRAIGASQTGIAWLWLRYGLIIGVTGSIMGGAVAYLIILNINPIHDWLGRVFKLVIWDPKVYYFTTIPNQIDPWKAAYVLIGGVLASVAGSLIPAVKAARMDPVKALRWE
jgi:lipoprotein-releasing system permease protein